MEQVLSLIINNTPSKDGVSSTSTINFGEDDIYTYNCGTVFRDCSMDTAERVVSEAIRSMIEQKTIQMLKERITI